MQEDPNFAQMVICSDEARFPKESAVNGSN